MRGYSEVERLAKNYELAYENGRQELFEKKELHIDVLKSAVAMLDERVDDLSDEVALWAEAVSYGYDTSIALPKWSLIQRFIMFVLTKHSEHKYDKALTELDYVASAKRRLQEILNKILVMNAW